MVDDLEARAASPRPSRRLAIFAAGLALALALPASVHAATGDLDRSFSGDGMLVTPIGADTKGTAVAVQPDGRIIAAGVFDYGYEVGVVRYLPNGALDPSFGDGAIQGFDFGEDTYIWVSDVGIDSQGRILIVGTSEPEGSEDSGDMAIARLTPAGKLDATFSGDGRKVIDLGGDDGANGLALGSDGRILVAGFENRDWSSRTGDFAVVRLTEDGDLDDSFSGDGRAKVDLGGIDLASSIALDGQGRIVLTGTQVRHGWPGDTALARLRPRGTLDPSFSDDGLRVADLGAHEDIASVAIQPGGKIVATGREIHVSPTHGALHDEDILLVRFEESGARDHSFAHDGVKRTNLRRNDEASKIVLQRDGKLLVAANTTRYYLGYGFDWVVLRYTRHGKLDDSFSKDGKTVLGVGGGIAADMAMQPNGRILEIGWSWEDDADTDGYGFQLARFKNDGLPLE